MPMSATHSTIHGSAVLLGARAMLIRGPSGSGKSQLAFALIEATRAGAFAFGRLVADDRVFVEAAGDRLLLRPADTIKGLIEIRGLGIRHLPFEPLAVAGHVIDLAAADAERLPSEAARHATIAGVPLARLPVAAGCDPLPLVLALLRFGA